MPKNIVIENFLQMMAEVPQYSPKNQNNLVAGANPIYYLDEGGVEQSVAPLIASLDWALINSVVGNIVHMIPSTEGTYAIYAITDQNKVYGISTTTVTDLGYVNGSGAVNNSGGRLAIAADILFAVNANQVYKMTLPSGTWTSAGVSFTSGGNPFIEPFLDFLALSYELSSTLNNSIGHFDVGSFLLSPGITLGAGFYVLKTTNYNDKYLAIAGGKSTTGLIGFPQNYLFLWNGIDARYNYSMRIPGQFIDMKVVDSVLYIAVLVSSGKTSIYTMASNNTLKKVITSQYATIFDNAGVSCITRAPLFDFKNYLGVHLNNGPGGEITDPLMIYGSEDIGKFQFIHSFGRLFFQICEGYDGIIYASEYVLGGNSSMFYLPITGSVYQTILYKSQWIPCKNPSAIDIEYNLPPQSGTDAINVKIYGRGEDIIAGVTTIDGISCQSATVLTSITPSTILNQKRTRLDLAGFVGDEILIKITTVNSSTWRPKLKITLIQE